VPVDDGAQYLAGSGTWGCAWRSEVPLLEARRHAGLGRCVAVDLAEERAPGDLKYAPPAAGFIA
jgi:hypothetical protein